MANMIKKNVALGCTVTTNATTYSTYTKDKIVDGNITNTNGYLTDAYAYSSPLIITLDLGKSYKISHINLKQLLYSSVRRCKDFEIQASNDNSSFTSIITSVLQNNDETQTFDLPNDIAEYRYWNLIIRTNYNTNGVSALDKGICEVELYIIGKFLLKQDNKHYTIKDNSLVLLDSQVLDEVNFNINGFSDLNLLTNISNNYKITKQLESNICEFDIDENMEKIEVV